MNLISVGRLVAQRRRAQGLTLRELAERAGIGRSTLAALEAGKLPELGFARIARLCAALDLVVDVRPLHLDAPLMAHRHLSDEAGRELTRAAIDDIIRRGDVAAWRSLVAAMRRDDTGRIEQRVRETTRAIGDTEPRAAAFAKLLLRARRARIARNR